MAVKEIIEASVTGIELLIKEIEFYNRIKSAFSCGDVRVDINYAIKIGETVAIRYNNFLIEGTIKTLSGCDVKIKSSHYIIYLIGNKDNFYIQKIIGVTSS